MTEFPKKKYFTIGEATQLCGVKSHILRYWEQEFSQLKPGKRRGNRRYYQQKDLYLILHIKKLLYEQRFTINGARQQLSTMKPFDENYLSLDEMVDLSIKELEESIVILENS